MINNIYKAPGKDYQLGGLINSDVYGTIISSNGDADIYDVKLETHSVSISENYGLLLPPPSDEQARIKIVSPRDLNIGDEIFVDNFTREKIVSITQRRGVEIVIHKDLATLNDVLISRNITGEPMDEELQKEKFNTCAFRSPERVKKEFPRCCGGEPIITEEYWCLKKDTQLTQPVCWNCKIYEHK